MKEQFKNEDPQMKLEVVFLDLLLKHWSHFHFGLLVWRRIHFAFKHILAVYFLKFLEIKLKISKWENKPFNLTIQKHFPVSRYFSFILGEIN